MNIICHAGFFISLKIPEKKEEEKRQPHINISFT